MSKQQINTKQTQAHKRSIFFKPMEMRISLLSHLRILRISSGQVTSARTINPTSLEPEKGGLFCNKIFRSNYKNNYICTVCSFRQNNPYRCVRCGSNTRLDKSNLHNLSIGHIELRIPIPHPWFLRTKIIHILFEGTNQIHDHKEINNLLERNPEIVYSALKNLNLLNMYFRLRHSLVYLTLNQEYNKEMGNKNYFPDKVLCLLPKKMRVVTAFIRKKQRPEWMFLKIIPILSPTYRPLLRVDDKLFITSDINILYQNLIERNNSLKKLLERHDITHSGVLKKNITSFSNEHPVNQAKMQLKAAVFELIDPSFVHRHGVGLNKSILKRLSGKDGRFRKDILGKRINFSGRTVITSGPRLKINQCSLPIELAMELFKPFILLKIRELPYLSKYIKKNDFLDTIEKFDSIYIKIIYRLIHQLLEKHPILLNRAPTLHRLNIQAFSPILHNTKALQLHPLVCGSFNADFDGDTMAIYVPHTLRSQVEARLLMMTSNNICSPATHDPIISPSQDIVFGLYYSTVIYEGGLGEYSTFESIPQMRVALENKNLDIHAPIYYSSYVTTPGRVLIYNIITQFCKSIPFIRINRVFNKKEIVSLIKELYVLFGSKNTALILDQLMSFGFYFAYKAGISLHKNDINTPNLKKLFIQNTQRRLDVSYKEYLRGSITKEEESKKFIREWSRCTGILTKQIFDDILHTIPMYKSSIYMLIHSGARGSMGQMRQLSGMRGLMMKPSGDILETPITSNFKDGLNTTEYFNSTHGARKGVIDTSLKTAVSGYLTRKLFYAAKDIYIVENDCSTKEGILLGDLRYSNIENGTRNFYKDIVGRFLAKDVIDQKTGKLLFYKNTLMMVEHLEMLKRSDVEYVIVKSPITCESRNGICKRCYGIHIDFKKIVSLGESVGILAAQSIGEPGTQLTMRTFHSGGSVLQGQSDSAFHSEQLCRVFFMNYKINKSICCSKNKVFVYNMSRSCKILLQNDSYAVISSYSVPYGAKIYVTDGEVVNKGTLLFEWDPYLVPIISTRRGSVFLNPSKSSVKYMRNFYTGIMNTGASQKVNKPIYWFLETGNGLLEYSFFSKDIMSIMSKKKIFPGMVLGSTKQKEGFAQDITGGLSKISKLFESVQSDLSLIAPVEGYIVLVHERFNLKTILYINHKDSISHKWHLVRVGVAQNRVSILVREHDYVYRGDSLTYGLPPIREIAEKISFQHSFYTLIEQIQNVYLDNSVSIRQKHLEVIIAQMYMRVMHSYKDINFINFKTRDIKKKIKIRFVRYPKDHYYSTIVSYLTMGLYPYPGTITLSGISSVTYLSTSFLSAASFQKTSKVLADASLWRGYDTLMGAQSNLFFGYLMPIGTGSIHTKRKKLKIK